MTIDEAIIQFKEDAEYNRTDLDLSWAEENEQVAKWLEELKDLREYKVKVEWVIKTHKQIKEETIDECIKLVGGNIKTITGIVFDNSIPIHDRALGRMAKNKLIEELVEQLKEQKNDI